MDGVVDARSDFAISKVSLWICPLCASSRSACLSPLPRLPAAALLPCCSLVRAAAARPLEIAKAQQHHGRRRELYFLRDKTGVEVDFALPLGGRRLALVEAKTTRSTPARPIPSPPRSWDSTRGPSMLAH